MISKKYCLLSSVPLVTSHSVDESFGEHGGNGEGVSIARLQVRLHNRDVRNCGGVRVTERWYLDHMGAMAFWRTVIGIANLSLSGLVVLKVFGLV